MITGEERPDPPPVDPGPSRRNSFPAIPTYDEALAAIPDASQGAGHARALTLSAYTSMEGPSLVGITTFGDDEDDPLVPRLLRAPPERVPRPLRRQTDPLPSHPAPSAAPENAPIEEESTENTTEAEQTETAGVVQARLDPLAQGQATLELPGAPADALPSYSPHLARDELRLISTVHLDQNHPAAAFFSAMTASAITANPLASPPPATDEQSTGGKKLKLTLTSGGETVQGSGRLFVRMGRAGVVEGKIHVGKVDHATGLEVSVSPSIKRLLTPDHRSRQHELLCSRTVYPHRYSAPSAEADHLVPSPYRRRNGSRSEWYRRHTGEWHKHDQRLHPGKRHKHCERHGGQWAHLEWSDCSCNRYP